MQHFTKIIPGKPLVRGLNAIGVAEYSKVGSVGGFLGNGARYGLG